MWNIWMKKHAYNVAERKEYNTSIERGKKHGWTLDIADCWRQYIVTVLMDNQSCRNDACSNRDPKFYEYSLPLVKDIWTEVVIPDIVSVQPMFGPCSSITFRQGHQYKQEEIAAKTRKLKAILMPEAQQDLRSTATTAKDFEDEMRQNIAQEIKDEIAREVFNDIRNNCGTLVSGKDPKSTLDGLYERLSANLKVFYGEDLKPNWIVRAPNAEEKEDARSAQVISSLHIIDTHRCVGNLRLYIDPLFPPNQAIMGFKGNEFESPYIYAPYIPLTVTPVVLDPETFCPRLGYLIRYGKKLTINGAKTFGRAVWGQVQVPNS